MKIRLSIILAILGLIGLTALVGRGQKILLERSVLLNLPEFCEGPDERLRAWARSWGFLGLAVPIADIHWQVDCLTTVTDTPIIRVDLSRCETTIIHAFRGTERKPWIGCPLVRMLDEAWQESLTQTPSYP